MTEAAHSKYSASGFEAAMLCPGKPVMEEGKPNNGNIYSATGTVAHHLLELALRDGAEPAGFLGRRFQEAGFDIEVDEDMVTAVTTALANIRDFAGDGMLLSEQKVNYANYLGVDKDQAWGTADVIVARGDELQVHDYKNGSGVIVEAVENPQMMLYGLGALEAVEDLLGPFNEVRLVIHQPNARDTPSEWTISVEDLKTWGFETASAAVGTRKQAADEFLMADQAWLDAYLMPGEKQCKFCKAKATCPKLRAEVFDAVGVDAATADEFAEVQAEDIKPSSTDVEWLSVVLAKADLIEDWVKAVRAAVESKLLAGEEVPGWKVVQGKKGNRKWADPTEVETTFKSMRLKVEEMYDFKLISPTSAEKLHKAKVIGVKQWPKLQALITQHEGKPHVAPDSDSRPALTLTPVADDFTDVSVDLA
jgi:hypothetical protein